MKIENLNLTVRTYNCLRRKGIDTVEQLQAMTDDELMNIRNFGIGCLKEVHSKLGKPEIPVIPGHREDDHNMAETAFHNGEEYMRSRIVDYLIKRKSTAMGMERLLLDDLTQSVRRM